MQIILFECTTKKNPPMKLLPLPNKTEVIQVSFIVLGSK